MTNTGRMAVAITALLCVVVLCAIDSATFGGLAFASFGTVLGYVFGDRNGEKRLANALTVLEAERHQKASES